MASREADFAARILADTVIMQTLTGGVYQAGLIGLEGIGRTATPAAFSGDYLLPCLEVRQRGLVPSGDVLDYDAQVTSATQVVELYIYEDRGYTAIDAALARLYVLFQGYILPGTFEVTLANVIDRQRDEGALSGSSLARQDWAVYSIMTS